MLILLTILFVAFVVFVPLGVSLYSLGAVAEECEEHADNAARLQDERDEALDHVEVLQRQVRATLAGHDNTVATLRCQRDRAYELRCEAAAGRTAAVELRREAEAERDAAREAVAIRDGVIQEQIEELEALNLNLAHTAQERDEAREALKEAQGAGALGRTRTFGTAGELRKALERGNELLDPPAKLTLYCAVDPQDTLVVEARERLVRFTAICGDDGDTTVAEAALGDVGDFLAQGGEHFRCADKRLSIHRGARGTLDVIVGGALTVLLAEDVQHLTQWLSRHETD